MGDEVMQQEEGAVTSASTQLDLEAIRERFSTGQDVANEPFETYDALYDLMLELEEVRAELAQARADSDGAVTSASTYCRNCDARLTVPESKQASYCQACREMPIFSELAQARAERDAALVVVEAASVYNQAVFDAHGINVPWSALVAFQQALSAFEKSASG